MDLRKREAHDASDLNYDDDGWIVSMPVEPEEGEEVQVIEGEPDREDIAFVQTETLADDLIAGMRRRLLGPGRPIAYRLFCDDARRVVLADAPIRDFAARVEAVIARMPDAAILTPRDDWFAAIVAAVCAARLLRVRRDRPGRRRGAVLGRPQPTGGAGPMSTRQRPSREGGKS